MDCLRTFNLNLSGNKFYSGSEIKTWVSGGQHCWQIDALQDSKFDIQGFKNINVFKIELIGTIQTLIGGTAGALVNNWAVGINMEGQMPAISGNILTPNDWSLNTNNIYYNQFLLGNNNQKAEFFTPIQSVNQIFFERVLAQGFGYQSTTSINLYWELQFICHYKFEGE
jgi:hypothetical protein